MARGHSVRVILEWTESDRAGMLDQLNAARSAMMGGIKEGEIWGMRINGRFFGCKRNKDSIRIYQQAYNETIP